MKHLQLIDHDALLTKSNLYLFMKKIFEKNPF